MGVKAAVETQGNSSDEGQQPVSLVGVQGNTHSHASQAHTQTGCLQVPVHKINFTDNTWNTALLQYILTAPSCKLSLIFSHLYLSFNFFLWISFLIFHLPSPSCIKFQRSVTFHTSITRETSPQPRCYPEVHCSAQLVVSVQRAVKRINLKTSHFLSDCQILFVTVVQPVCLGKGLRRTVLRWDQNLIWICFFLWTLT